MRSTEIWSNSSIDIINQLLGTWNDSFFIFSVYSEPISFDSFGWQTRDSGHSIRGHLQNLNIGNSIKYICDSIERNSAAITLIRLYNALSCFQVWQSWLLTAISLLLPHFQCSNWSKASNNGKESFITISPGVCKGCSKNLPVIENLANPPPLSAELGPPFRAWSTPEYFLGNFWVFRV